MPIDMPAPTAWYRKAVCIASRTASLPRNENEKFDTPPEIFACGRLARIHLVAAM